MTRAILCLAFVAVLASISHARVIEKRSPVVADFADQIDNAIDLRDIGGHIDTAVDEIKGAANDVENAIDDAGSAIEDFFGRKKRSPGVADLADQIDEAVDLKVIGGHIDTAIDAVEDFGSDAIDEIKDFAFHLIAFLII